MLSCVQTMIQGSLAPVAACASNQAAVGGQVSLFSDTQQLAAFVNSIIPLLFQVWAEVEPSSSEQSQGQLLCR